MRLFVAVDLDEPRRLAAARASAELARRLGAQGLGRAVKWVEPRNLHLTVRFIGEADEVRAARIQQALAPPLLTPAFMLALGGLGVFPPRGSPRVLWMGVVQGASALADLHDEVEGRLQAIGESPEARGFSAHLTLARLKELDRAQGETVRRVLHDQRVDPGACQVGAVTLYQSRLAPGGPTYTPLSRSPLAR
jgi:2'-5' RNA ligase